MKGAAIGGESQHSLSKNKINYSLPLTALERVMRYHGIG